MTELEFMQLPNRKIRFITYTGRVIIGGNYTIHKPNEKAKHYILTSNKENNMSEEEKIEKGILVPIKPEIIEEYIIIQ